MDLQKEARSIMQEIKGKYPDIGMQFCLMKKGKVIVNVNEGFASFDKSRKVDDSTLFPIYSTSKIVPGAAITKLIEEGVISPDQKVTDFWPEFGQNGKESTLVRHLLHHTSGVPQRLKAQTSYEAISNWKTMTTAIEEVACDWIPGTKTRYQSLSYGWLTAELIQRATGMSFKDYIIKNLGFSDEADFVFGLNDNTEKLTSDFKLSNTKEKSSSFSKCDPLDDLMKEPLIRRMVQPGFNGFASALGLASFMDSVVNEKFFNRQSLLDATSIAHRPEKTAPTCEVKCWGYGFALSGPVDNPGLQLGHGGYGGTEVVAHRDNQTVCSFTTNILGEPECVKMKLYALAGITLREGWAEK